SVFGASADVAFSPTHSLAATTAQDWVTSRAWATTLEPADVEVSASVYLHHNMPLHLLARGTALDTMTPSYYGLQIMPGLWVKLVREQGGVETGLGYAETGQWFGEQWARFTFSLSGSTLRAQVFRPDRAQYLTPQGNWVSAPT